MSIVPAKIDIQMFINLRIPCIYVRMDACHISSNIKLLSSFRQAGHSASPPPEMRMSGAPITRGGDWCDLWISSNCRYCSYPDSFETLENELSHFGSLDSSHVMKHQPLGWIAHSLPWLHVWKGKFPRA